LDVPWVECHRGAVRDKLGLPVEPDLHFIANKTISAYAAEARASGGIVN
jgi:hypothetical protein